MFAISPEEKQGADPILKSGSHLAHPFHRQPLQCSQLEDVGPNIYLDFWTGQQLWLGADFYPLVFEIGRYLRINYMSLQGTFWAANGNRGLISSIDPIWPICLSRWIPLDLILTWSQTYYARRWHQSLIRIGYYMAAYCIYVLGSRIWLWVTRGARI